MLGLFVTFVFVAAGCISAAVIATSLRNALPVVRRLAADRRALAEDSVYLFTLIETPRHGGRPAPVPKLRRSRFAHVPVFGSVRRRVKVWSARLHAAA